jgi:hypothetical protein
MDALALRTDALALRTDALALRTDALALRTDALALRTDAHGEASVLGRQVFKITINSFWGFIL